MIDRNPLRVDSTCGCVLSFFSLGGQLMFKFDTGIKDQVQDMMHFPLFGRKREENGPHPTSIAESRSSGLTQHLDPQVDEEEPPAGTPTGCRFPATGVELSGRFVLGLRKESYKSRKDDS